MLCPDIAITREFWCTMLCPDIAITRKFWCRILCPDLAITREFWGTELCPDSATLSHGYIFLKQSQQSRKLNISVPRTDRFKSSPVYSGSVLRSSLSDLLDYHPAPTRLNHVICVIHYALIGWPCILNLATRLQRSALLCFPFITHLPTSVCYWWFESPIQPHSPSHIMFDV